MDYGIKTSISEAMQSASVQLDIYTREGWLETRLPKTSSKRERQALRRADLPEGDRDLAYALLVLAVAIASGALVLSVTI